MLPLLPTPRVTRVLCCSQMSGSRKKAVIRSPKPPPPPAAADPDADDVNKKDAKDSKSAAAPSGNTATASTVTPSSKGEAKDIQLEDKSDPDYIKAFVEGWSEWQPYLKSGEDGKKAQQNPVGIYTQTWLKKNKWSVIPHRFGVYALGVLPPDVEVTGETTSGFLEREVLIVNHGIVGGRPNQANTLNGRLMKQKKAAPYDWAFVLWMKLGFRVYVKWRVIHHATEEKLNPPRTSVDGAAIRKGMETAALKRWKFFLNTSEQVDVKGKGCSLNVDAYTLPVRYDEGGLRCAGDFMPQGEVPPQQLSIKMRCLELLTATGKTDTQRIADTIAFMHTL